MHAPVVVVVPPELLEPDEPLDELPLVDVVLVLSPPPPPQALKTAAAAMASRTCETLFMIRIPGWLEKTVWQDTRNVTVRKQLIRETHPHFEGAKARKMP